MHKFHSYMGRIALDCKERAVDDVENEQLCKELSQFWRDGDINKLSPKAKEIWNEWKKENERRSKSNVEEINEWESK